MFERILIPTDGSSFCEKALERAIGLAVDDRAELTALSVVPRYAMNYFDGVAAFSPEEIANAEASTVNAAQLKLQAMVEHAEARGVKMKTAISVSDGVADGIIAAAVKHDSDLIVMASHGRSGFARLLIGSDTDQVLSNSKVPVLVIR